MRMRTLIAPAVLTANLAIAAAALLFLLPSLKEGYDRDELAQFAALVACLAVPAAWSWRAGHRASAVIAAIPLLAYLLLTGQLLVNLIRGWYIESRTEIIALSEQPIVWPGFDGPVGIRLNINIRSPSSPRGNLLSPKIATRPLSRRDYFSIRSGLLAVPLYAFVEGNTEPKLLAGSRVISYELFPDYVARYKDGRVCISEAPTSSVDRGPLSALWFLAGSGGLTVDLSEKLTRALRQRSSLVRDSAEWSRVIGRLQPGGLITAGYVKCAAGKAMFSGEVCYCRD